jgi:hypothetical protein
VALFFLFLGITGIIITLAVRKSRRDDEARDAAFRATMLSLEEKAKKEGTFVVSYFDGESAKRS